MPAHRRVSPPGRAATARPPSQRQLRVGEEIRHALARILARGELHDPALVALNVSVTEVRLSPDMKNATAYVMPLGGADPEGAAVALNRAAGFLRTALAGEIELRHVPRLLFAADRSFDQARRVEEILARPSVRRDLAGHDESDENDGA